MKEPFFDFFSRDRDSISRSLYSDAELQYKTYNLYPPHYLPKPPPLTAHLGDVLLQRKSPEHFAKKPLSEEHISTILRYGVGNTYTKHRTHPSGGGKYPLEIYPVITQGGDVDAGVYHYNIPNHALEKVRADNAVSDVLDAFPPMSSNKAAHSAPALFLVTFSKSRSFPKYADFAYKLGLIEAGHIGQNIYLVAEGIGLHCRALSGGETEEINSLLYLDGVDECFFYTLAVGYNVP